MKQEKCITSISSNTKLKSNKISLGKSKTNTLADLFYHQPLQPLKGLPPAPIPNFNFNFSNFKSIDFLTILQSKRNVSSLDINMITYKVCQKCLRIRLYLFKVFFQSCIQCSTRVSAKYFFSPMSRFSKFFSPFFGCFSKFFDKILACFQGSSKKFHHISTLKSIGFGDLVSLFASSRRSDRVYLG